MHDTLFITVAKAEEKRDDWLKLRRIASDRSVRHIVGGPAEY
jgi:hypothetical protein